MLLMDSLKLCVNQLNLTIINESGLSKLASVVNDSRQVKQDDVYIAIVGERFDGHQFIDSDLLSKSSLIVSEKDLSIEIPYLKVNNSIEFIQKWAHEYRNLHHAGFVWWIMC